MKKFRISVTALVAALFFAATPGVQAQAPTPVSPVSISRSGLSKVRLTLPANTPMDVAVMDQEGVILYQEAIRVRNSRGLLMNLNNLPDGRYYITATNNDVWMSQGISKRNDQVSIDAQNTTELVRPALVAYAKNKYEVAMPGADALSVAIYDRMNELVYTQSFKKSAVHRFDLTALPTGEYTFVYGPEQKQFTERVAIK